MKYSETLLVYIKKCYTCIEDSFKKISLKKSDVSCDLVGNKTTDKMTSKSKTLAIPTQTEEFNAVNSLKILEKRCILPKKPQQIIEVIRLIPKVIMRTDNVNKEINIDQWKVIQQATLTH